MAEHFILMGDVIGSRKLPAVKLHEQMKALLSACNKDLKAAILSPYTTTLGDEFQGIATSSRATLESVFYLEDTRMRRQYDFEIRYVVLYGEIETAINREIAYGMMGAGLSRARELLTDKRRGRPRFQFDLPQKRLEENLTRLCRAMEGLAERWGRRDYPLILDMLSIPSNEEVAVKYGKNRSQIWKRRKNLLIEEYQLIRTVALDLIDTEGEKAKK
jgi:hypothetical protein